MKVWKYFKTIFKVILQVVNPEGVSNQKQIKCFWNSFSIEFFNQMNYI